MSKDTWDPPTWQDRDLGPGSARGTVGGTFYVHGQVLPFSSEMSGVVSFLIDSSYTDGSNSRMTLHSISFQSSVDNAFQFNVYYDTAGGNSRVDLRFRDNFAGVQRYIYLIGDEDGVNWLQADKWYQLAFSATSSGLQVAMNGSNTPTLTKNTDVPGALNLNQGTERWWFNEGAYFNMGLPSGWGNSWSSLVRGPAAFDGSALDLSDSDVLARIFDANGDLTNPGENGSKWWNDAYTTTAGFKPDVYMVSGVPRNEKGSAGLTFTSISGGGAGFSSLPGGLRKFYE